jgi:hypothetical protein
MANETVIITLGKELPDRARAIIANQRLLVIHKVFAWTIFLGVLYLSIEYQSSPEHFQKIGIFSHLVAFFSFLIPLFAGILAANVFTIFIMWIPSFIFARVVPPQMLLIDGYLIYVGGSVAKQYGRVVEVATYFKYLLGVEKSQVIARSDIKSVEMEDADVVSWPFDLRLRQRIVIVHKNGKLLTGFFLSDSFRAEAVREINNWLKQGKT